VGELEEELSQLSRALEDVSDEEQASRDEIEEARRVREEAATALETATERHGQRRSSVDEQAARVTEVRVSAAQAQQRVESDRAAMDRLVRSIEELDAREERLRGDVAEGAREQGRIAGELLVARERREVAVAEATAAHQALDEVRARYDEARHAMGGEEVRQRELRTLIEEMNERVSELTVRDRELTMEIRHLTDHVDERHRVDVRHVLTDYHHREVPDAQITDRIAELQRLIERMGEINLMAIEEYEESSQRYDYLKGQQTDLEDALIQLDRAIRQMNRESKRMFREAFDQVNGRFQQIFPLLFRGGKAELKLSDPDNLLESGIDIIAQPPGKKLGSLELMSGGEKALTAVALIFAIFQYKPSPFCLLDEVDAPLDEANITRFAQAIRQMTDRSQFIVITHAKRTMEYADTLYGVTMEKPGVSNLVSVELTGDRRPAPSDESEAAVA
jgi:chromosome segregation protein